MIAQLRTPRANRFGSRHASAADGGRARAARRANSRGVTISRHMRRALGAPDDATAEAMAWFLGISLFALVAVIVIGLIGKLGLGG